MMFLKYVPILDIIVMYIINLTTTTHYGSGVQTLIWGLNNLKKVFIPNVNMI